MERTSSTQYLEWCEYLRTELNDFHREDEYFNRILAAIYQLLYKNTGHASPMKPADFQLNFITKKPSDKPVDKALSSASSWCTYAGLSGQAGGGSSGDVGFDSFLDGMV
jgi:hypothetical protein